MVVQQTKDELKREDERGVVDDPLLAMRGVGKQMWQSEGADAFIERLRRDDDLDAPPISASSGGFPRNIEDIVWDRLKANQGGTFETARGLPFTYKLEGAGIWFYREGRQINRKLTRSQLNTGISRCPLRSTTDIADLIDYAYLFGLLTDRRIRGEYW